ncbi:MAG: hypothetical protein Q8936_21465 [Bacillota bacterium]|nr:hypothetical protein [Bacillota bacterium]
MIVRNLSSEDTENIRMQLNQKLILTAEKWHPYWYPLFPVYPHIPVIAFGSDFIAIEENLEKIRGIFVQHNVHTAIQLPEFDNGRIIEGFTDEEYFLEKDEDGVILPHMSECFWFDFNKDWMIYASHEATIAFEGEWLVNNIKEQLENYSNYEIKNFIPKHRRNFD